jgi:hypothetical protein
MHTTSSLLAKLKEFEQVYTSLENKMNNLALVFSQASMADVDTVAIEEDDLGLYFKIDNTIEDVIKALIQFVEDTEIIPMPERSMLLERGRDINNSFRSLLERRGNLFAVMCVSLPNVLYSLSKTLDDKFSNIEPSFDSRSTQIRISLCRDGSLCYAYYQTFDNVQADVLIPLVSIVIFQKIDTDTGYAKGTPLITVTTNADNAPNRLQGVCVVDSTVMLALVEKMLDDAGIPLLKPLSTKLTVNENMLSRKWENVTTYANIIRIKLNMLLWPQYFVNTDNVFQPTEKLEADLFNDIKKATGYDDAGLKYRMELTYPVCTIFFTLGATTC